MAIEWSEPPDTGRPSYKQHSAFADQLRANPSKWALWQTKDTATKAAS